MAKLVRNLEIIDQTEKGSSPWQIYSSKETVAEMHKLGVTTTNDKGDIQMIQKSVYKNTLDDQLYVFKKNSFSPHGNKERKLEISTAVNEYTWSVFIDKLFAQTNNNKIKQLRHDYVPVKLIYIFTDTANFKKVNKTVCSYTPVQEGFYNRRVLKESFPELFESLSNTGTLNTIPDHIRVFSTMIGKAVKGNDLIFNELGELKALDTADASPFNLEGLLTGKQLFDYIDNGIESNTLTVEKAVELLELAIDVTALLLKNKPEVIQEVYSLYSKVNLTVNPMEKNRPAALSLYEQIWLQAIPVIQDKISELKGETVENKAVIDVESMINSVATAIYESNTTAMKNFSELEDNIVEVDELIEEVETVLNTEVALDEEISAIIDKEESKLAPAVDSVVEEEILEEDVSEELITSNS